MSEKKVFQMDWAGRLLQVEIGQLRYWSDTGILSY